MKLAYTRAMLNAALHGELKGLPYRQDPVFRLSVPTSCPGVPAEYLDARGLWEDKAAYDRAARDLALRFNKNFEKFDQVTPEVAAAGPAR